MTTPQPTQDNAPDAPGGRTPHASDPAEGAVDPGTESLGTEDRGEHPEEPAEGEELPAPVEPTD